MIEVSKQENRTLRVQRHDLDGADVVSVRIWFTDENGEDQPTRRGFNLDPEIAVQLAEAILKEASNGT